jgi:hypothetical protein
VHTYEVLKALHRGEIRTHDLMYSVGGDQYTIAQFFKQKSSCASRQVCRPGAEQAHKFMSYFTKQVYRPSAEPADKLVGWLMKIFV